MTVNGTAFEVSNNGTTKPTAAQVSDAGASATDANKQDGWVLDGTKWAYSMGASSGTLNSISDLANLVITADCVLSPLMKQNTYSVVLNGGKATGQTGFTNATTPVSASTYTTAVALGNPTWTGRTFVGWYTTQQSAVGATPGTSDKKINTNTAYNTINTTISSTANEDTTSVTLYAWWNAQTVPVKFNGNTPATGLAVGSVPDNTSVSYGNSYTITTTKPTANGYTFAGWATSETGAVAYAAGGTIPATALTDTTNGITLYAKWTEKTGYKVTFYANQTATADGNAHNTQSNLNWTGNVSVPADPTAPAGYSFGGWYTIKSGTSASGNQMTSAMSYKALLALVSSSLTDSTMEIKMYAKWDELGKLTFTMNLNGSGATYNGSTSNYVKNDVLYNGSVSIPNVSNPTRTGYNFKGWSDTASGAANANYVKGYTFNPVIANKTIYAVWEAAPVTLTYAQGPSGSLAGVTNKAAAAAYTVSTNYGATVTVPSGTSMFDRNGYTFTNWAYAKTSGTGSVAAAGGNLAIATSGISIAWTGSSEDGTLAGTATVYPNWTAITYTIKWDTQGGNSINNTTGLNGDSTINTPSTPTRAGYTFQGWHTTSSGTGGKDVVTGNLLRDTWTLNATDTIVTAYAIWKEKIVEIRFFGDGSKANVKQANNAGAPSLTLFVGEATGALYASQSATTPGTGNINQGVSPVVLDNHYEFKTYTSGNDATYTSKWTVGSPNGTAVASGWVNTAGTLTIGQTGGLYVSADYYLTMSPKKYNYTIEYYNQNLADNGYSKVSNPSGSGSQFYGHSVTAGTTAGASGTTLTVVPATQTGFTRNAAATGSVNSITIGDVAANNVLKFYYDRNTYTLTVNYTGDRPAGTNYSPATQTVKYGASVTLTNPTVPAGYNFSGWSATGITFGGSATPKNTFTMPASNVTVTGTWGIQTVNVTFKVGANGTINTASPNGAASQNVAFNSSLTAIPGVTITNTNNYYFMGWALYKNCGTAGNETTGTLDRIYSPEEILGTGAYVGNAWKVPAGNSTFVARIMPTLTVSYVAGTGGAFTTINGTVSGTTVTTGGTYYAALPSSADHPMDLPKYCVNTAGNRNAAGFDASGTQVRNANSPKAAAGYKFVGWTWKDTLLNETKTCYGSYNAAGVFTKLSGDDMPTAVNQSYTFTGVWEKTYQQLHFVNTCANGTGVTGGPAPADVCAQMGDNLAIPTSANYAPTNKPASAYTFKGWTTSSNYTAGDPLYNTTFQMTAGTQSTGDYTMAQAAADGGYGVTLYPVFEEKSVTINYALATGITGVMGSLNKSSENIKMNSGFVAGSTATAKTGYTFKGWFADAAHTIPVATAWVSGSTITPAKGTGDVFAAATYYAYFEAEEYAITFKVGDHGTWQTPAGDKTDKTMNLAYNTTYGSNIPATKNDTGYGFKHWVDQNGATYSTSVLSSTKITGPMTFTAVWEARSGYTIVFETNGGTPALSNKQVTWTANLNNSMDSSANNLKKQGYSFGGWYAKADCSDASKIVAADTFQTGIDKAGITVTGDTATLTLYAKWTPNNYTISYNPHWPKTNPTTYADRSAVWTDTNLLPSGGENLSMDGFTFTGWNTNADGSGKTVTNLEALSEIYVSLYGANDYSTTKTITLHATWGTKKFNVEFKDPSGTTLKTETNKNWDDAINYYAYTIADGSKRLLGWKYTPVGGTETTWNSTTATKLVSEIGGDADSATNGKTYILTAILEDCTKYEIRFNKVNLNPDGTPNVAGATVVSGATKTGWTTPGVAIDIKNFNGQNYITAFENQNGAGRRADLKGYALDESFTGTKILATAAEVTSGGTIVFNVYWVEKLFNIEYQLGASSAVSGNKPYAGTDPAPAGKSAGWNSTNVMPDTTPTWTGYKAPVWQYQNASGNWVDVPSGAKVSDIAKSDDNTQTIILKALWNTDQVRIIYAAQTGGSAKNGDGSFTVNAGASKNQDLDAVTGIPYTMTATAASGYIFTGWYKDGVLLTNNATMTPEKVDGLFTNSTYEARFRALGSIQYTIEHWFEGLDGTYAHDASKDATRGGQEYATINVTNDMKLNVKGFTFKSGVTGEKLTITSLVDGEVLKLFYERNTHRVDVQSAGTGADQPTPLPTPTYTATGITQAHTTQRYDTVLTLPTMTYDSSSWGFKWLVSFREPGASTAADAYYNNGETFNMPDADVDIIGVWERKAHKVTFTNGDEPHGTVIVKNGKVLPFTVTHGKSMSTDPDSTGNYVDIEPKADATWAWAGWEYLDENGVKQTTMDPDTVIINCDTTFKALWAQTFFVAYSPTAHGGAGFTSQMTVGKDIVINTPVSNYKLTIGGVDRTTNAPAADGYRFVGWSWNLGDGTGAHYWITPTASDFDRTGLAGTAAEMTFPITNNVIFEAIWEALEQDLSYKLDTKMPNSEWAGAAAGTTGDTFVVTPKPRTDQTVTLLTSADVTKPGHSFKGWAIWTDANGDGIIDESELGEPINGTFKMPAQPVIFVPVWDFESIVVYFQVSSGSAGKGTLAPTQENITDDNLARLVGSVPTAAAGYVFAGWFTDDACTNPVDASWILSGDRLSAMRPANGWVSTTYYAKFVPGIAEYQIQFYLQNVDGTYTMVEAPKFADINTEDYADVTDPANAAYSHLKTFAGYNWNQDKFESVKRAEVKGDGSTVLKLYFDRLPFEITYDLLEGGAWAGAAGQSSAIADSTVSFPAVNRPGYKHDGWTISWTDPDTGELKTDEFGVSGSFTMPKAAVHAIAKYIKYVDVIIEYYVNDADPANKIGERTKENAALANTIYTASGEDVRALRPGGYSNPASAPSMRVVDDPDNPNILKVIYVRIAEYKLKFDPNGGTGTPYIKSDLALSDTVAEYGPNTYKKTGYTQGAMPKRWNTQKDGNGLWITADTTYEEIAIKILGANYDDANLSKTVLTVYAIWFQNAYEVKYDLNNDMTTNSGIIKPVPDWRNPMIVEDKKGVSWDSKGFNILSDEELDAAPAGYEFAGWNTKADGSGMTITDLTKYSEMSNYINKNVEQKSITLYAMWKEIIIKIEYVTDGGGTVDRVLDNVSAVTGQHVGQGSSAGNRLHSVATAKPGYHFIGWELYDAATHGALRAAADTNGVNAWHTIKNDDSELVVHEPETDGRLYAATYIARFAANDDASVVYDANGGEGQIDSTTLSHGLTVDLSDGTGFNRAHYTLVSWNTKEDGSGTKYELGTTGITMPEGGIKLYAQWAPKDYGVHTAHRDDEIGKVIGGDTQVEWGKPLPAEYISALSATAKPRSTFTGWRYTMVDADTGQTHTGVVQDLSELIVRGPLTVEAEFETEPEPVVEEPYVSPVPKTGDERTMLPMLAIMMIAALAAIAGIIALFVARRREDETDEDELTAATGSQLVTETAAASAVAVRATVFGNRRMVLRRALAASFVAVCLCLVGFAPGIAFASTDGTGPNTSAKAAQSDPVTSSTGSFQSTGPKAGYVGHQDAPSSSASSSDAPKVAACGPAAAGTTSGGGSTAGYVGSGNSSTSTNAANKATSAGTSATSAQGTVKGGIVQYVTTTGPKAGYTGTYLSLSGPKAGYTGSSITMSGAKAGYLGSFNVVPVSEGSQLNTGTVTKGTVFVATPDTRAAILSQLAHASSKSTIAKASSAYSASDRSKLGFGTLYYYIPKTSFSLANSSSSGDYAQFDVQARDLSSLGSMSLDQVSALADGRLLTDRLLNGASNASDTVSAASVASVPDAIESRNKWMLSSISPSANVLGAACLLADFSGSLEGSTGALPTGSDGSVNAFPDMGEARLRDEDMVMGRIGLAPDVFADLFGEAQVTTSSLLLVDDGEALYAMPLEDVDESDDSFDETAGGLTKPVVSDEPVKGEEGSDPVGTIDPDDSGTGEEGTEPSEPTTPENPGEGEGSSATGPNSYVINFDTNGGMVDESLGTLQPVIYSNGSCSIPSYTDTLTRPGYSFLCWNTKANGSGVAIRDYEGITDDKLMAMFAENDLKDEDGANTKLYAQWNTLAADPAPSDPPSGNTTQPKPPVVDPWLSGDIVEQPSVSIDQPSAVSQIATAIALTAQSEAGATLAQFARTTAAFGPANPVATVTSLLDVMSSGLGGLADALGGILDSPMVTLDIAPVSSGNLVTVSNEVLAGVSNGQDSLGDVSPVMATQVVGAVATAVTLVVAAAAVTGSVVFSAGQATAVTAASAGVAGAAGAAAMGDAAAEAAAAAASRRRPIRRLRRRFRVSESHSADDASKARIPR